jgi:excisionase family DNA binding protein
MTVAEAADKLDVSERWIHRLAKRGRLRSSRRVNPKTGRQVRHILAVDVSRYALWQFRRMEHAGPR